MMVRLPTSTEQDVVGLNRVDAFVELWQNQSLAVLLLSDLAEIVHAGEEIIKIRRDP